MPRALGFEQNNFRESPKLKTWDCIALHLWVSKKKKSAKGESHE